LPSYFIYSFLHVCNINILLWKIRWNFPLAILKKERVESWWFTDQRCEEISDRIRKTHKSLFHYKVYSFFPPKFPLHNTHALKSIFDKYREIFSNLPYGMVGAYRSELSCPLSSSIGVIFTFLQYVDYMQIERRTSTQF
jgi:hypothetical protein